MAPARTARTFPYALTHRLHADTEHEHTWSLANKIRQGADSDVPAREGLWPRRGLSILAETELGPKSSPEAGRDSENAG